MLLAIDVGNSDTTLGVFEDKELRATWHMASRTERRVDEYAALMFYLLQHEKLDSSHIKGIVLCSVVPPLITTFVELSKRLFQLSPLVIGAGVKTGVRIRMDNPREVGADRIVNAAAAHHLYGGPIIITDMGTATTFDVISKKGEYLGGVIAPGITSSLESLSEKTEKLFLIDFKKPTRVIGKNTEENLTSGIFYHSLGGVKEILKRIKKEIKEEEVKVIATGGLGVLLKKECKEIEEVNPDLTLQGLNFIGERFALEKL